MWHRTLLLLVALATGCAGPQAPRGVDAGAIDFQARNGPVEVFVDGPGSKARGARSGAAAAATSGRQRSSGGAARPAAATATSVRSRNE